MLVTRVNDKIVASDLRDEEIFSNTVLENANPEFLKVAGTLITIKASNGTFKYRIQDPPYHPGVPVGSVLAKLVKPRAKAAATKKAAAKK